MLQIRQQAYQCLFRYHPTSFRKMRYQFLHNNYHKKDYHNSHRAVLPRYHLHNKSTHFHHHCHQTK